MKSITYIFLSIALFISCNKEDMSDVALIGNWKLIEVGNFAPFQRVSSNKIITFNQDGSMTSNGTICNSSINTASPSSGTYSIADSTFRTNDCNDPDLDYRFVWEGSEIIIHIPCIEFCKSKYKKQ